MTAATASARIDYRRPKGGAMRSALATVDSSADVTPRERAADDFYVEEPWFVDAFFAAERFTGAIWDPACGTGTIPKAAARRGLGIMATDLVDRGFGLGRINFLETQHAPTRLYGPEFSVVCNPPFALADRFIEHALALGADRVAMLLRWSWLEGGAWENIKGEQRRAASMLHSQLIDEEGLARIYVAVNRVSMPPGASGVKATGGAVAFGWMVWERGHKGPATFHRLRRAARGEY